LRRFLIVLFFVACPPAVRHTSSGEAARAHPCSTGAPPVYTCAPAVQHCYTRCTGETTFTSYYRVTDSVVTATESGGALVLKNPAGERVVITEF